MKRLLILVYIISLPVSQIYAESLHSLLNQIETNYSERNYYSAINLCREIVLLCEENPTSECCFTNIIKDVYRYKGLIEYELYKKELKPVRLESSIRSLKISYDLYNDAEMLYLYGYLSAVKTVLYKEYDNLNGLVDAWKGILELYAHDNWNGSDGLLCKIKDYLAILEKYAEPNISSGYSGTFARFMIFMACNLADKLKINVADREFINRMKTKYSSH